MLYACFVLNFIYYAVINGIPTNTAAGSTHNIIPLLRFRYWQPVNYVHDDSDFPNEYTEERGLF